MSQPVTDTIRALLAEHARLGADVASLSDTDDLYAAGMTSHSSVQVMLALEDEFDVEFPDAMLKRSVFESVDAIAAALTELATVAPLREELRRRGVRRAAGFSWRRSAEAHVRAYRLASG